MSDHWEEHMACVRGHDLADLRWHWGEAYEISWDEKFRAARVDDGTVLEVDTAKELWERIRDDYLKRPVRRPP